MAEIRGTDGSISATFEAEEIRVLGNVLDEMTALLRAPAKPGDAVRARLFPDAYEDPEDQRAYEELVGDQLLAEKVAALRRVRRALPTGKQATVELDHDQANDWLTVINDIRLAIGTRLDVTEDVMQKEIDPEDPDGPALAVLHWLGWMQELFLKELTGYGDDRGDAHAEEG